MGLAPRCSSQTASSHASPRFGANFVFVLSSSENKLPGPGFEILASWFPEGEGLSSLFFFVFFFRPFVFEQVLVQFRNIKGGQLKVGENTGRPDMGKRE